jgi:hypothetical protein
MRKLYLLKTMLLLCALIVGSSSAWAEEEIIATGTFAKTSYTSGWTCTGTGTGTTGCIIIGKDEYISSPALNLSGYSKITISITARRYGGLSGSKATIDASISGTSYGTTDATSTSVTARDDIEFEPTSSMTSAVLVFTCTNATSAGSSHGAGIGSITIKGTKPAAAPTAITFKTGETTYTNGGTKNDLGTATSVDVTIEPDQVADVYYTLDGSTPTTSSTKYTAPVAITGPCTLTALATNTAGNITASAAFKFSRANGLAFGEDEYTAFLSDGTFSTTLTNPNNLAVTYESLDEDVATVANDGTVTLLSAGETLISASFVGDDTYAAGSAEYLLTVSDKAVAGIAYESDFIQIKEPVYDTEIAAPIALTNPNNLTVTYSSTDETVATVNASTGAVTPKKKGTTTIKATFEGNVAYEAAEVSYTLMLGLLDAGLLFGDDSKEIAFTAGATYTNDFIKDTDADPTFESSNTSVATVDATTGEVTVVSVGTTTISASTLKTSEYEAGYAEYTLTVTEYADAPTIAAGEKVVFYESFDTNDYTGGNDGSWGGTIASGNPIGTDNDGWTFTNGYGAYKCVRFGKSGSGGAGNATTPALGIVGDATLTFKMGSWNGDTNEGSVDIIGGGTFDGTNTTKTVSIEKGEWKSFELSLKGLNTESKIKFYRNANKRLFLDEVKITVATAPAIDYTVPSSGWGSFCSAYKLDLSNDDTEIEAYAVTDFDAEAGTVTFTKATGVVPAKTPLIIKGEAGAKKIAVDQTEATGTAVAGNLLTGYLSPTYYDGDRTTNTVFGLSGGNFHKLTAGTIPANRAVLSMSTEEANKVGANEGRFVFLFDEENGGATSIDAVSTKTFDLQGDFFDLSGRRVANPTKGLYIVNGKKVVIK